MADEIIQRQQQAPYIEKRSEQLLASVFGDPNAVKKQTKQKKLFNYVSLVEQVLLNKFQDFSLQVLLQNNKQLLD